MNALAVLLALAAGAAAAVVVCRAVHMRLLLDVALGIVAVGLALAAVQVAQQQDWPLIGLPCGYLGFVLAMRIARPEAFKHSKKG